MKDNNMTLWLDILVTQLCHENVMDEKEMNHHDFVRAQSNNFVAKTVMDEKIYSFVNTMQ